MYLLAFTRLASYACPPALAAALKSHTHHLTCHLPPTAITPAGRGRQVRRRVCRHAAQLAGAAGRAAACGHRRAAQVCRAVIGGAIGRCLCCGGRAFAGRPANVLCPGAQRISSDRRPPCSANVSANPCFRHPRPCPAPCSLLAPVQPGDRPLCVLNTHLFFHYMAPHIRTMHVWAMVQASGVKGGSEEPSWLPQVGCRKQGWGCEDHACVRSCVAAAPWQGTALTPSCFLHCSHA